MNIPHYHPMKTNKIHSINDYLPLNADSYDEVYQYYTVRCSEWHRINNFELDVLDNGVYCAKLTNAGQFNGISFYIPYHLRGKGKLKETIDMFPTTRLVTMRDCHVIDAIKKYTSNVVMPPALSDSLLYRDLRNSLCSVRGIRQDFLLYEINDYLKSVLYSSGSDTRNDQLYKLIPLANDQRINDIIKIISK